MRHCSKCKLEKEKSAFAFKNKTKGTYSSECKECHRLLRREYYLNNTEKEKKRVEDYKIKYIEWFKEMKSRLVCLDCSENHIATLQFHHLNPEEKEIGIADAVTRKWSKSRILLEIEKCDVLCANCHAKRHWNTDNAGMV